MAAATGIWNQHHAASQSMVNTRPAPLAGPGSGNNGSDPNNSTSNSATISANDFLTLLVTEMQNQDPTDQTDPNEYINQLVQVNSLEQLIDINQNLSTALGSSSGSAGGSSSGAQLSGAAAGVASSTSDGAPAVVHPAAQRSSALGQVQSTAAGEAASVLASARGTGAAKAVHGNLSVPEDKPASHRVAHALTAPPRAR